jgi:hypothetical protein
LLVFILLFSHFNYLTNKFKKDYSYRLVTIYAYFFNSCGVMFGGSRYEGTIVAKDHPNAQIC